MADKNEQFDLIIVGGGLVGASMACALSGHGLSIAVIEAVPLRETSQPSYDDRTLALSLASSRIFSAIGLWPGVKQGVTPIEQINISNRGHFGGARISARELEVPALGYVAEGRLIGQAVRERLPQCSDVTLFCPMQVISIECTTGAARVAVKGEEGSRTVEGRLLIGADGAQSMVRDVLGLSTTGHDYQQTAIIANVTPEISHRNRAFERFTRTGPLAVLPHVGDRCGIVWSVASEDAESVLALDDDVFLEGLQERFGYRLGRLGKLGRRSAYPLRLLFAREQYAQRGVIIGNAAHAIHPISAQGFNLGLRDVAVLAELLVAAHRAGEDLGSSELLERYQVWRRPDHERMIRYTDSLVRIFAQPWLPVRMLRGLGLAAFDLAPPVKRALSRRTMGFGGRVPRLAQGQTL
jgi:2-octaprenyl-6-methoxyphenol hydroxylase